MMETRLDVPIQLRELAVISIDNIEKAFAFFFDAATKSIAANSPESITLLKRVIAIKIDYTRKIALAKDVWEATALQFAYCRAQIDITADLIRVVSDLDGLCQQENPAHGGMAGRPLARRPSSYSVARIATPLTKQGNIGTRWSVLKRSNAECATLRFIHGTVTTTMLTGRPSKQG